jgi:hypothetical protein
MEEMVKKYRKKPVEIEAIKWTGSNYGDVCHFAGQVLSRSYQKLIDGKPDALVIPTLEGDMVCRPGDFIIKGVQGEFYPCKPDIFAQTYEEIE